MQESDLISFISYDEEHHRVAFLNPGPLTPKGDADVGINHIAFNYASLGDLVTVYERLKRAGIVPHWCINHGPTTSAYYKDPDGNGVELEVDNYKDVAECKAFMRSPAFVRDQRGAPIDLGDLVAACAQASPSASLLERATHEKATV